MIDSNPYRAPVEKAYWKPEGDLESQEDQFPCPRCGSNQNRLIGWPSIYRSTGWNKENVQCLDCGCRYNQSTGSGNLNQTAIKNGISYSVGILFLLVVLFSILMMP